MGKMTEAHKEKIVAALTERGATAPCPRCGNQSFSLSDGYFLSVIQTGFPGVTLGGQVVPWIVVICTKCGFMSQHALGVLGLMDLIAEKSDEAGEVASEQPQ